MNDLGTLGGSASYAWGINNDGQVVGYAVTANGLSHAFLYNGTMNDLGTLGGNSSLAYAINNSGQAVGYAAPAGNAAVHAFFYSGGTMFDLNNLANPSTPGTQLQSATGINDSGQIVANGSDDHAYILTPSLPGSYLTGPFPPRVRSAIVAGGNFQLTWNSVNTYPPVGYQVQYTINLSGADWINVGGVIPAANGTLSATNTIGTDPQRFYRVLLVQ
jgi:probable HAF family extracellular repeat protein